MIEFVKKNKSIILYIFFGGLTTLINILAYSFFAYIVKWDTISSNVIAWILSVIFAYVTNRKWVFESQNNTKQGIIKEISSFFSCRFLTGVMDVMIMYFSVDLLGFNGIIMKCISNIIVIVVNYVASKLIIFK